MNDKLYYYYYTPSQPTSYGGARNLKRGLKGRDEKEALEGADDWLTGQDTYTLHKPIKHKFERRKTIVSGPGQQLQADLIDIKGHAQHNDGYKYLLTHIDVFSRLAGAIPLKNKSAAEVSRALDDLFKDKSPARLQTDKGKEFLNSEVKRVLKDHRVHHFTSENENIKASIVERWNRTLRNTLHRYFTKSNGQRYLDILDQVVAAYNDRYHEALSMSPNQVDSANSEDVFYSLYDPLQAFLKPPSTLEPGDHVRISKARTAFQRGYTPNWSVEVFTVTHVIPTTPYTYRIQDWKEEPIEGTFYAQELQKIKEPETYRIESVLDRKKVGRRNMVLVKWLGYPESFNQWIPESDVVDAN